MDADRWNSPQWTGQKVAPTSRNERFEELSVSMASRATSVQRTQAGDSSRSSRGGVVSEQSLCHQAKDQSNRATTGTTLGPSSNQQRLLHGLGRPIGRPRPDSPRRPGRGGGADSRRGRHPSGVGRRACRGRLRRGGGRGEEWDPCSECGLSARAWLGRFLYRERRRPRHDSGLVLSTEGSCRCSGLSR